jgi:hypothetical protein
VPKRTPHGRPNKAKTRARRTPARPDTNGVGASPVLQQEAFAGTGMTTTVTPAPTRTIQSSAAGAAAARRSAAALRKSPGIAINYHYLRRDITALLVLAPGMVVLLVLAFLFLH